MVERFNQTCKKMLHHVMQQHGRQWHKFVPLTLWALREVPNATTGTSPYMLVYGRNPRGPLTILKESWTGENDTSVSLAQPVADYLLDLRSKLSEAADLPRAILMLHSMVMLHITISGLGKRNFRREIRSLCWPLKTCLLYTSPSPRDGLLSRMPSSA